MTWFIVEYDGSKIGDNKFSIVGVDEFRNDAYLSELNIGKSRSVNYMMFESVNQCKGYNDGSYYARAEDGIIAWRSCESEFGNLVPPTPIQPPIKELELSAEANGKLLAGAFFQVKWNDIWQFEATTDGRNSVKLNVHANQNITVRAIPPDGYLLLPDRVEMVEFDYFSDIDYMTLFLFEVERPLDPMIKEKIKFSYALSGDEIDVFAEITNNSNDTREYRAFVYNPSGLLLDKEPDLYWENIKSGKTEVIKVTSRNDPSWDINDVFPSFRVRVFEQKLGYIDGRIIELRTGSIIGEPEKGGNPSVGPPILDGENGEEERGTPFTPEEEKKDGLFGDIGNTLKGAIIAMVAIGLINAFKPK